MGITLTEGYFTSEQEALAEITDRGWHAVTFDVPAQVEEMHWHDFDAVLYVLDGTVRTVLNDGTVLQCGRGARIDATAGTVHGGACPAYRATFGFSIDPAEMTQPINKPGVPGSAT
jgi:hypothetical protein